MNSKRQGIFITVIVILVIIIGFLIYNASEQQNNTSEEQVLSQTIETPTPQPATSTILGGATSPTYSGADLVRLRQQCAAQAQQGLNVFAKGQVQIDEEIGDEPGRYSLNTYHFNEKLGACLIVVDDSFYTPKQAYDNVAPNTPADTTTLINIYEDKSIMNCTSYGEPVASRLCYDDQGDPGNLVSYDDWTNILNQYLNE